MGCENAKLFFPRPLRTNPEEVLGFYTLSLFELSSEKLPKKYAKKYKGKIPAVKLARLATAKGKQNQGLGRHMLINAIMRVISISEHTGVIGFFVDAKNKAVKRYYEKFGILHIIPKVVYTLLILYFGSEI